MITRQLLIDCFPAPNAINDDVELVLTSVVAGLVTSSIRPVHLALSSTFDDDNTLRSLEPPCWLHAGHHFWSDEHVESRCDYYGILLDDTSKRASDQRLSPLFAEANRRGLALT